MLSYVKGPLRRNGLSGLLGNGRADGWSSSSSRCLAGSELLPGDESDRRPAADVPERGGRLLGPVTATDRPETRHAR